MRQIQRTVLWRRLDTFGGEYCSLVRDKQDWLLEGLVVADLDGVPVRAHYEVRCDDHWTTRAVTVDLQAGDARRELRLTVDEQRQWWIGGEIQVRLGECLDIDLSITPATNTLPIRRLGLEVGQSQAVVAAWVRFPGLTVELLPQRYTRLAKDRYRYESNGGAFVAEIEVDDAGLVVSYADGWERVR